MYAIGRVFIQLILDDSNQWHLVTFFSWKMILAETRYETHDSQLLAIVETFKTWKHYLEESQHEMLIFTNYNNLCRFMDMKNLSFEQIC